MSDANSRQVGGDHYQTPIQPWDFIIRNEIGFLEGNAIKYIVRHKKTTSGRQDLEKAIHYLQKVLEVYYPPPVDASHEKDRSIPGRIP